MVNMRREMAITAMPTTTALDVTRLSTSNFSAVGMSSIRQMYACIHATPTFQEHLDIHTSTCASPAVRTRTRTCLVHL